MAKMASADIMCVGPKSVREKFTGIIRYDFVFLPLFRDLCLTFRLDSGVNL